MCVCVCVCVWLKGVYGAGLGRVAPGAASARVVVGWAWVTSQFRTGAGLDTNGLKTHPADTHLTHHTSDTTPVPAPPRPLVI